ncbi:ATP-binding protein [Piscinibacter sp. XHJ-5]|uniref:ATP-binding protein n=1 Tax=Piscinibacter sp. XHJ-5 TaxID=3037797 RepID=UPI0024533BED|nr:ATP-binding protein [Piscinibacter sp. XHJ-5]
MTLLMFPAASNGPSPGPEAPPRAPQTVEETGLSQTFLIELVAKAMFQRGLTRLVELSQTLSLSGSVVEAVCQFMRRESILEISRRGQNEADLQFDLTAGGRARAADWLARSSYVGPAPVPLEAYIKRVRQQSATALRVTEADVRAAFADVVVPNDLQDQMGIAINSGRPMLLYGSPGSGKTYLAERMRQLLRGSIAVPHAICVHGEVIRVFDEHWHKPWSAGDAPQAGIDSRARPDARWIMCERPCVMAGGELTLEMLDLSFDARAGYYEAPPHFKANNGLFIVDDLGRQVVTPGALMNRWIVPMERGEDYLMLRTGGKFSIPFNMVLVFCSNLRPQDLDDSAFLRRMGQKVEVRALGMDDYRKVFEGICTAARVGFRDDGFERLMQLHRRDGQRPTFACYPRDLINLVVSRATYLGADRNDAGPLLEWAWGVYFATPRSDSPQSGEGRP